MADGDLESRGAPPGPATPPEPATRARRVLAIVVHWTGLEESSRCLESLLLLNDPDHELLVVDNGSTDGSGEELARRFPQVEMVRSPENLLYAGGANIGLRKALMRGFDYALLLNNDTTVAPDLIERLLEVADSQPTIGLVGPKILYADQPEVIWSAGGRIDFWRGMAHHLGLREPDGPRFDRERAVDYLTGCCMLVHRRVIVDVGYLDTSFQMYSEDADWCVRARGMGYGVRFAPRARVWHAVSASSGGGLTPYKMYHRVRSNLLFLQRHAKMYHWLTIPFLLPLAFLRFARREGGRGNRDVVSAGWRALFDLIRRAPRRAP